jgi:hypothetical protein
MADSSESSAAQLRLKHAENSHHTTLEEVPDEEYVAHGGAGDSNGLGEKPSWGEPMSVKSAGKQKAQDASIDTQSHELFPELGGPKPRPSAGVAPIWSAKTGTNGKANGAGSTNGTPRTSSPASGLNTPIGSGLHGPPSLSIPGRNVETLYLEPQHVLPRNQLRRPLPDIIKDLNRKSRATVNMATMGNGKLKFEAAGPQDIAQQVLKDLVQQIGTKVRK